MSFGTKQPNLLMAAYMIMYQVQDGLKNTEPLTHDSQLGFRCSIQHTYTTRRQDSVKTWKGKQARSQFCHYKLGETF